MPDKKKLPEYENFKAPWEIDDKGESIKPEDQKIDPERLKKHLYNVSKDKERLQDANTVLTTERDEFKGKFEQLARKDETDAERVKRENEELKAKLANGSKESLEKQNLRLKVALEKGLNARQAARLVGDTEDELMDDADDMLKDLPAKEKGTESSEDEESGARRVPRQVRGKNNADPDDDDDVASMGKVEDYPIL